MTPATVEIRAAALGDAAAVTGLTSARRRVRAHAFYRDNGYEDWTSDVARLFHKQLGPDGEPGPILPA